MNPSIAAACISGGVGALGIVSTVITAWIGSRNTRRATEQAIEAGAANTRATLAAAREDRLWERRCAVYEETMAVLLYRQEKRRRKEREHGEYAKDNDDEEQTRESPDADERPGWIEAQARIVAYGSDEVLEALNEVRRAQNALFLRREQRSATVLTSPHLFPRRAVGEAQSRYDKVIKEAWAKDEALIDAIRSELRSRPEAATPPPALPAVRRRIWLHRQA